MEEMKPHAPGSNIATSDMARWVEQLLCAIVDVKDRDGLKVHVTHDMRDEILRAAIDANNNSRGDAKAFKAFMDRFA